MMDEYLYKMLRRQTNDLFSSHSSTHLHRSVAQSFVSFSSLQLTENTPQLANLFISIRMNSPHPQPQNVRHRCQVRPHRPGPRQCRCCPVPARQLRRLKLSRQRAALLHRFHGRRCSDGVPNRLSADGATFPNDHGHRGRLGTPCSSQLWAQVRRLVFLQAWAGLLRALHMR